MSFVHCVEDVLGDEFPVPTYEKRLFEARCIDYAGKTVIVRTFAHDFSKIYHNIPKFIKRHITEQICKDFRLYGMPFFRADAASLFQLMSELARQGITIYPHSLYRRYPSLK